MNKTVFVSFIQQFALASAQLERSVFITLRSVSIGAKRSPAATSIAATFLRRSDGSRYENFISPRRNCVVATFIFTATFLRRSEHRCDAMENIASQRLQSQRWETIAATVHRSDGCPSLR